MATPYVLIVSVEQVGITNVVFGPFYDQDLAEQFAHKYIDQLYEGWDEEDTELTTVSYDVVVLEQPDLGDK